MKKTLFVTSVILALTMLFSFDAFAQKEKKEKVKKERVKKEWEWPGLPEKMPTNKTLADILLEADKSYNTFSSCSETVNYFNLLYLQIVDADGNPMMDETGKPLTKLSIVDNEGNTRNVLTVMAQWAEVTLTLTNLGLEITNLGLSVANAALEVANDPLQSIMYGAYTAKHIPNLIGMEGKEIAAIISKLDQQRKTIKEAKKNTSATDEYGDVFLTVDASTISEDIEIVKVTNEELLERAKGAKQEDTSGLDWGDE